MAESVVKTVSRRKAVWLTWERQRRTTELAHALSLPLVRYADSLPRLLRYLFNGCRTASFLLRTQPEVVVVQNPSIVLAWLALLLKPIVGFKLVLDNHNDGVRPFSSKLLKHRFFTPLYVWLHRGADLNIVTNMALANEVEAHSGRAFVLPDKLPGFSRELGTSTFAWPEKAAYKIVFICTFAPDEPVKQVIEAARILTDTGIHIFITGSPPKNWVTLHRPIPSNCHLLGFLTEEQFITCLCSSDAIMDFTEMDDCLVCGAYEAVTVGKPLLTSNTRALREYFRRGTVYTGHAPEEIAAQIQIVRRKHEQLTKEMREFKGILEREWQNTFVQFQAALDSLLRNRKFDKESTGEASC